VISIGVEYKDCRGVSLERKETIEGEEEAIEGEEA
jgi:hypothetical protein